MDLTFIRLTQAQEALVDKLAENAHNVWARDRIRQGWTYGIQQVRGDFARPRRLLIRACGRGDSIVTTESALSHRYLEVQLHRSTCLVLDDRDTGVNVSFTLNIVRTVVYVVVLWHFSLRLYFRRNS